MYEPIIYIDQSEIREGKLEELKAGLDELAAFVEQNEPRLLAYRVYLSQDRTHMSVVHIHTGADSLAYHMEMAGRLFPKFADLVRLVQIDVYGQPGKDLEAQLREKAEVLGSGRVLVHDLHAGFERFGSAEGHAASQAGR